MRFLKPIVRSKEILLTHLNDITAMTTSENVIDGQPTLQNFSVLYRINRFLNI